MQLPDDAIDHRKRLRRVEGQVRGVEKMLVEGREYRDIDTQSSAATIALEKTQFKLISSGMAFCVEHPEEAGADDFAMDQVQSMFMKLT